MAIVLTQRDREILQALEQFNLLSATQLCHMVFGGSAAISYCRERLKRLFHARHVDRLFLFRVPTGSPLCVYTLKRRNSAIRSQYFLEHTLAITDFILAVMGGLRGTNTELTSIKSEAELRKNPIRVNAGGKLAAVIPDCYLSLRHRIDGQTYQINWCVEIDRATEAARAFRRKVRAYLAFAHGPFQRAFKSSALTVIVLTTAGEKRVATLKKAIETEVHAASALDSADLFRIGTRSGVLETEPLLQTACFRVPFKKEPVSLLRP